MKNKLSKRAYNSHKGRAKNRGIEFLLSYEEWLDIWIKSGKLPGTKSDDYCMARHNDLGPYAIGNVSIITMKENSAFAVTHRNKNLWYTNTLNVRKSKEWKDKITQTGNSQYKGPIVGTNVITGKQIILKGKNEINNAGFSHQHVYKCVNGKLKTHKGYTWQRIS
jgi:hypothetical protein